jgi:hypothetical protein
MISFSFLLAAICLITVIIYGELRRHMGVKPVMDIKLKSLAKSLEELPQSNFWINCRRHGDIPLTQAEYDKQTKQERYYCPGCGEIPRKIWKKL